jgi:hypothetical protein
LIGMTRASAVLLAALATSLSLSIAPGPALASFGFQSTVFSVNEAPIPESEFALIGPPDVQAGSHPWGVTIALNLHEVPGEKPETVIPDGDLKDLQVKLPAGLIGGGNGIEQCTIQELQTPPRGREIPSGSTLELSPTGCPADSQVGIAKLRNLPGLSMKPLQFGVYNLEPPPGIPAELGINVGGVLPVLLEIHPRTGGDYGLTVALQNASQSRSLFGATITLWGIPADPSHDRLRGECAGIHGDESVETPPGEVTTTPVHCPSDAPPRPFLTLPTHCSGAPLAASVAADSWQAPESPVEATVLDQNAKGEPLAITGCERLDFSPHLSVRPDTSAADSPTGLSVDLALPTLDSPTGLAEAQLRGMTVALPPGIAVSPSAANGRVGCTAAEVGLESPAPSSCPPASTVGSVAIQTPLLPTPLTGSIYLARQGDNEFHTLLALYVVAEGSGAIVKLAGKVALDPLTGQLTASFENLPQLPFSDLRLRFFEGARAVLATPPVCGSYEAVSVLSPWSETAPVAVASRFEVDTGCVGAFAPSFIAGSSDDRAGAFSPVSLTLSRTDREPYLGGVSVTSPPGLLGMLGALPACPEPQAAQGDCSAASQIGHVTVAAGPGSEPIYLPQAGEGPDPVYLTGPYRGAPFGLAAVVPVRAGPFDLGTVVQRFAISVDPHTAQLTITGDPLPQIRQGVPLQLRTLHVEIDRAGFMFNPTNCAPRQIAANVQSVRGASASVTVPFAVRGCRELPFAPMLSASTRSTGAHNRRSASLTVRLSFPTPAPGAGQASADANLRSVKVALPTALPVRLATLRGACPAGQFATNPASCKTTALVGTAVVHTPLLSAPATGPAYLVSHGGHAFPDLVVVLQAQGIRIDLVGSTSVRRRIVTGTFASLPDVPVQTLELRLPAGPHSLLTAAGRLCHRRLAISAKLVGQNGAVLDRRTRVHAEGCRGR